MKKTFKILLFICFSVTMAVFSLICATAVYDDTPDVIQPDASATIKDLNIIPDCSILQGDTLQMRLEKSDEFILFDSVEWSSSKPDVISCTKSGEIKGLKEGKSTITVKAKVGKASDSITVYCAKKLNNPKSSRINLPIAVTFRTPRFWDIQAPHFYMFDFLPLFVTEKLQVKGVYDSYFYVEFERNETKYKGFIFQNWMPNNIATDEIFKQLSTYDLDVFVNLDKDQYKVTTNYKGAVDWKVSDENIIDFNETTGKVKGIAPGTATISATVGSKTLVCTVHSIYRWPLDWTGAARQATYVYKAKGNTYEETSDSLAVGEKFTVKGDMGGNSSWAYGVSEDGTWGFVPISHISTKGTVSQYNNMGWSYPLKRSLFKHISSPYGWRGDYRHLGLDINRQGNTAIEGEIAVAPFDGTVVFANTSYNTSTKKPDYGYCVVIEADNVKDPVSGEKLRAVYMHFLEKPMVDVTDSVIAGETELGKIGSTGKSTGPHLHLEINNKGTNFAGSSNNDSFDKTINPIFFFLNSGLKDDSDSTYNEYWYNDNK